MRLLRECGTLAHRVTQAVPGGGLESQISWMVRSWREDASVSR